MPRLFPLLALAACTQPPLEQGKIWPSATFFTEGKTFAGFPTSQLAVKSGQAVPWRGAEYGGDAGTAGADALVVQPAYFEGAVSAYVITEIWEHHPDPWVQPVYQFVKPFDAVAPGTHLTGADGVFGVDTQSTFYSPFWRLWWAEPQDTVGPYTDVRQISKFPMHKGPMVVCPIVPAGVTLSDPTHPFTGEMLRMPPTGYAYVNGTRVEYLNLGGNRQVAETYEDTDSIVLAEDLYLFAQLDADGTRTLLDLPAVLPANAAEHAYLRRIDVVLTTQAVFVPASLPDLRARLSSKLMHVDAADPAIPDAVARAYLLRVAKDGACFANAATFPSACVWLDSEEAIEDAVAANRIFETDVTLTATTVLRP